MFDEAQLLEKLKLVEALHAGAATPGERDAAASARERILRRLRDVEVVDPPVEYTFHMQNPWSRKLFSALLRRYDLRPYRYRRQRYTTVMAKVSKKFLDETLWPQFRELDRILTQHLNEVTERVIGEGIHASSAEPEERPDPHQLETGGIR